MVRILCISDVRYGTFQVFLENTAIRSKAHKKRKVTSQGKGNRLLLLTNYCGQPSPAGAVFSIFIICKFRAICKQKLTARAALPAAKPHIHAHHLRRERAEAQAA